MIKLKYEAAAPATSPLPHYPLPQGLRKKEIQYGMEVIPVDWTLVAWKGKRMLFRAIDIHSIP